MMHSILIVDDEKDNLQALHRLLRSDFEVTTESSPFKALKLIQSQQYAVVLSDQRMPEMSGVELLEKTKRVSPDSTRVILTGYSDSQAMIDAINRGDVYRYVTKPWSNNELRVTLKQAAEAYELRSTIEQKKHALETANHELKLALAKLRTLDNAKARFLSLVSHELKTPLTVLSSFVQLLEQNQDGLAPKLKKAVQSLSQASIRFEDIINEVLDFVRLEAEGTGSLGPVPLKEVLSALESQLSPKLRSKDLQLKINGDQGITAFGNEMKLGLAFQKLIENAIQLSETNARIELTIEHSKKEAIVRIFRTGREISAEAFSPFTSGDLMHHHQGLGLELALGKAIIEQHGGSLTLEKSSAKGTEIKISLPSSLN